MSRTIGLVVKHQKKETARETEVKDTNQKKESEGEARKEKE